MQMNVICTSSLLSDYYFSHSERLFLQLFMVRYSMCTEKAAFHFFVVKI